MNNNLHQSILDSKTGGITLPNNKDKAMLTGNTVTNSSYTSEDIKPIQHLVHTSSRPPDFKTKDTKK